MTKKYYIETKSLLQVFPLIFSSHVIDMFFISHVIGMFLLVVLLEQVMK